MAEHSSPPSSPWKDLLWFIALLVGLFFLWVLGGGPQRAAQQNQGWLINGPVNTAPTKSTNPTMPTGGSGQSGQIEVHPVQ
jgi:hypothetical protein